MGAEMSNKRRRRPSLLLTGLAAAYSCGHCTAITRTTFATPNAALVDVIHDPDCPVLLGLVESFPAVMRACSAAKPSRTD
jgi:hypothetical protein